MGAIQRIINLDYLNKRIDGIQYKSSGMEMIAWRCSDILQNIRSKQQNKMISYSAGDQILNRLDYWIEMCQTEKGEKNDEFARKSKTNDCKPKRTLLIENMFSSFHSLNLVQNHSTESSTES